MIVRYIAGHEFVDTARGCRCRKDRYKDGATNVCNVALCDILSATEADIGKYNISHSSILSNEDFKQIEAERERIWRCF